MNNRDIIIICAIITMAISIFIFTFYDGNKIMLILAKTILIIDFWLIIWWQYFYHIKPTGYSIILTSIVFGLSILGMYLAYKFQFNSTTSTFTGIIIMVTLGNILNKYYVMIEKVFNRLLSK